MKVLIVRYNDQPAVNIVDNMTMFSRYRCDVRTRDRLDVSGYDVVFYYNINDIFTTNVYDMLVKTQTHICVGAQSWRFTFESEWIDKFPNLNVIGVCSPTGEILDAVLKRIPPVVSAVTPFSADRRFFTETDSIRTEGKLRVGYIGTFREDKRYLDIVKPAFDQLKGQVEFNIIGKASGKRVEHTKMVEEYNTMDCLVVGSKYESGPMPPLEAALCGRPTITTKCGMMQDVFEMSGAIFISGDYNALVNTIKMLMIDRDLCISIGQDAKNRLMYEWDWSTLMKKQDDFFERVYNARETGYAPSVC